ncbi:MAG TPA: ribonuclease J, partial [Fimbriimonadaceae bacterium]|nr:ribonuclease J [Fimbriimonadaceae bacterium]
DTLIYSARPIPGNEAAIWRTINRLFRQGAQVIYESSSPIHVSGHGYEEELKMMINLTRPYYIAPVHGEPRHQHLYLQMARKMGWPERRTFTLVDGVPLCFDENTAWLGDQVPCGRVLVDRSGHSGLSDEVLRDRSNIARDGVIVATIAIDVEVGELIGDVILQSKGFNAPAQLLEAASDVLYDSISRLERNDLRDVDKVRHEITDVVKKFVNKRTQLRPVILPTIIEV